MKKYDDLLPLSPLTMAILLALADGDRHGYALMQVEIMIPEEIP